MNIGSRTRISFLKTYQCDGHWEQVSLEKSADASEELDKQRDVYRGFARAGSAMFFLVEAMQVMPWECVLLGTRFQTVAAPT